MKPRKHWWIWILVAVYIWLIFRNSLYTASASSGISQQVTHWILNHLEHFGLYAADEQLFHHYVRKLAHFTEFAGLGFLVTLAMQICPLSRHRILNFLLFLVAVPFADETIQRYVPGRGSSVHDMLIDGSGYLAGGLVCYILILIIRDLFFREKRHKRK